MSGTAPWPRPAGCAAAAPLLIGGARCLDGGVEFSAGEYAIKVRSNSQLLLERLAGYFSYLPAAPTGERIEIIAIEREACESGLTFREWRREPGKQGGKDASLDLADGRLVLKLRTGMLFLQSEQQRIAAGPCLANVNQLINFINSQIMNRLQQQEWLICHAAALSMKGRALAIAGFSGNGKSTQMLHMMEHRESRYLTNDRLFLRPGGGGLQAVGIPKLPRINPGTLVNNPRLACLLPVQRREALLKLPKQALWELEEKHDVDVARCYGAERIDTSTPVPLLGLLILNWQRESGQSMAMEQVDLAQRRDLLPAVMKSPGPFYRNRGGHFLRDDDPLRETDYLRIFRDTEVFEVTGRADFALLTEICFKKWYEA